MNLFPVKKILILVAILALPGFLYYLLREKGKNRYHPLEIYGPKKVASTFHKFHGRKIPDTIYHHAPDFTLTNQAGNRVSFASDTSALKVICFFSGRANNAGTVHEAMNKIANEFQKNKRLRFFSVSVDPRDTRATLNNLAGKYRSDTKKWNFLTGDDALIRRIANTGFFVDALKDSVAPGNYLTSPMLILTDPSSRIRGYYDSANPVRVSMLSDEIKVLITEELRKIKGAN